MNNTRFCLLSLLLIVSALVVHFTAFRSWSRNAEIRARAVTAAEDQRVVMQAEAGSLRERGSILYCIGLSLAVASAVSLVASFRRHELARWRPVSFALLAFYAMFQFVMV